MSESRYVRVSNPGDAPFTYRYDSEEYTVPAGGHLDAPEAVGQHLRKYNEDLELEPVELVPTAVAPAKVYHCPFPGCDYRTDDFAAFVKHTATHAKQQTAAEKAAEAAAAKAAKIAAEAAAKAGAPVVTPPDGEGR